MHPLFSRLRTLRPTPFSSLRLVALALGLAAAATRPAPAQQLHIDVDDPDLSTLAAEVARLAEAARGTVGVAAYHLETGRGFTLNGDQRFPMASTYKVPIAVRILSMVDAGEIALGDMIEIEQRDVYLTASTISDLIDDPGLQLSIHNLLEMMLQTSDNIATDVLMRVAGGAAAVTAHMAEAGIDGIRVDRPTWALIANWLGAAEVSEQNRIEPGPYRQLLQKERSDADIAALNAAFNPDPRDTSTPAAMAELLTKIWNRELLSEESSALLIDIMYRCQTGEGRLKGVLPPGTQGRAQDRHDWADDQRRGHHRPAGRCGSRGCGRLHQGVGDRGVCGPRAGDRAHRAGDSRLFCVRWGVRGEGVGSRCVLVWRSRLPDSQPAR